MIPVEIFIEIVSFLSRDDISRLTLVNKRFNNVCSRILYSNVTIVEDYDHNRFYRSYKFFRTMSSSSSLPSLVSSLKIIWRYPEKVYIGFDSIIPIMRTSFRNMRNLKGLVLRMRISKKNFKKCFPENCHLKLERFICNFGTKDDISKLLR
jgi:hypothetical protein